MTGTEHSFATLRAYERTIAGLVADPEVTGDLLLLGMWLARATILNDPPRGEGGWSFKVVAQDLWGPERPYSITGFGRTERIQHHKIGRIKKLLGDDAPHYDPARDNPARVWPDRVWCSAPMVRRAGPCGKPASSFGYVTDLSTGRKVELAACGRPQHRSWYEDQLAENRRAMKEAGDSIPTPAANTGGALARHIKKIQWSKLWRMVDPRWEPPPEGAPTRKPKLAVIRNDAFEPVDDDSQQPPTLTVHEGGWR